MECYHKIQTVWLRDPDTKFRTLCEGQWATPEFEYLRNCEWVFTEKVDGTNIRIDIGEGAVWQIGGRTNNAQIPAFLLVRLTEIAKEASAQACDEKLPMMTLYGEGYGAKIQKGANYISDGVDFVLFDVKCGDIWLERENVEDIASKLGIKCVPILARGTLQNAVNEAQQGFNSCWGDFAAEGIVMRPAVEMLGRRGNRIIAKVKTKDFAD